MKKTLHSLTLRERLDVIFEREKDKKHVKELAEKYKCGKSQIYEIIRAKDKIMDEWINATRKETSKRATKMTANEDINRLTFEWFSDARNKEMPVSGPILKARAKEIAEKLGKTEFKASNGWLESFRRRHNIKYSKRHFLNCASNTVFPYKYATEQKEEKVAVRDLTDMMPTDIMAPDIQYNIKQLPPFPTTSLRSDVNSFEYVEVDKTNAWNSNECTAVHPNIQNFVSSEIVDSESDDQFDTGFENDTVVSFATGMKCVDKLKQLAVNINDKTFIKIIHDLEKYMNDNVKNNVKQSLITDYFNKNRFI